MFGIKLRLHKKNNLWSLQGYNHIIHKSLFVTKALLLPVIPHSKIMQSSTKHQAYIFFLDYLIILPTEIRLVRSCTVQSDIHVWIRKGITSWCPAAAIVAMISLVVDIIWIHKQWYWTRSSAGFNCVLSDPLTKQYEGPAFLTLCWRKP